MVELDTQGASELLYTPGDHVAIYPANEKHLVDRILSTVDTDIPHDSTIKCEFLEQKSTPLGKLVQAIIAMIKMPNFATFANNLTCIYNSILQLWSWWSASTQPSLAMGVGFNLPQTKSVKEVVCKLHFVLNLQQ